MLHYGAGAADHAGVTQVVAAVEGQDAIVQRNGAERALGVAVADLQGAAIDVHRNAAGSGAAGIVGDQ